MTDTATPEMQLFERQVEMVLAMRELVERFGASCDQLAALASNDVMFSGLVRLDANGQWTKDWQQQFEAVSIDNHSTSSLTVTPDAAQGNAPTSGEGIHRVHRGGATTKNMTGRELTIYGASGDLVGVQVFARAQPPSVAPGPLRFQIATSTSPVAVAQNAASVTILAANTSRTGGLIFNNGTTDLYLTFGATSSTALFTHKLGVGQALDLSGGAVYSGIITGIWGAAGAGNAMVTELV